MPNFESGAQAALLIGTRDATRLNHRVHYTDGRDIHEITTFQPVDNAKEFAYGLLSGAFDAKGFFSDSPATVNAQMATASGKNRNAHLIAVAPRGFAVGNEINFFETKSGSFGVDLNLSGITTADPAFSLSKNGVIDGVVLHNPHGSTAVAQSEQHQLNLTNAPASQEFALRAVGGTQVFVFTPSSLTNGALKSGVEGLPEYAGRTATVTGSNFTGSALKSGSKLIAWDGNVDVPALEVLVSESQEMLVAGGNSGNYSVNGSANFALGDSNASIQTKLRTTGGHWASVVVVGSSAAPVPANPSVVISGAGNAGLNGTYVYEGTYNSANYFHYSAGGAYVWWDGSHWTLSPSLGDVNRVYESSAGGQVSTAVATTGWAPTPYGTAPAPTVVYNAGGAGTPGTADLSFYFPYTEGNVTQGATTGTGATMSTVTQGGAAASTTTATVVQEGYTTDARYNVVTTFGSEDWVDNGTGSTGGYDALLNTISLLGTTALLTVSVKHADDDGNGAPDAGTISTVFSFAAQGAAAAEMVRDFTTTLKRWTRCTWTLTGTSPQAVFAVSFARH